MEYVLSHIITPYTLQHYTPSLKQSTCYTHLYGVQRYVTILTTILPNMQLYTYTTNGPILISVLFLNLIITGHILTTYNTTSFICSKQLKLYLF
jgi:hypothetical protein